MKRKKKKKNDHRRKAYVSSVQGCQNRYGEYHCGKAVKQEVVFARGGEGRREGGGGILFLVLLKFACFFCACAGVCCPRCLFVCENIYIYKRRQGVCGGGRGQECIFHCFQRNPKEKVGERDEEEREREREREKERGRRGERMKGVAVAHPTFTLPPPSPLRPLPTHPPPTPRPSPTVLRWCFVRY